MNFASSVVPPRSADDPVSEARRALIKFAQNQAGQEDQLPIILANLNAGLLNNTVPGLLDKMVAFELLERSEDSSRAVGVSAFKLGGQLLVFVPIFYMSGKAQTGDVMYIRDYDLFVPLTEEWINFIEEEPAALGEAIKDKKEEQLFKKKPKLTHISDPMLSNVKMAHVKPGVGLPDFFKAAGAPYLESFLKFVRNSEKYQQALFDMYKPADFEPAADMRFPKSAGFPANVKLKVIRTTTRMDGDKPSFDFLSEAVKQELITRGVVIQDNRDANDLATVYEVDEYQTAAHANEDAVYDVIMADGSTKPCIVVRPIQLSSIGDGERSGNWLIVDCARGAYRMQSDPPVVAGKVADIREYVKSLPTELARPVPEGEPPPREPDKLSPSVRWDAYDLQRAHSEPMVLVSKAGRVLEPCHLSEVVRNDYTSPERLIGTLRADGTTKRMVLIDTPKLPCFTLTADAVYADYWDTQCFTASSSDLRLGTYQDYMFKSAGDLGWRLMPLDVFVRDTDIQFKEAGVTSRVMRPLDAQVHLITSHGMPVKLASTLIAKQGDHRYLVKRGASLVPTDEYGSYGYASDVQPEEYPDIQIETVDIPDEQLMSMMTTAAQQGQKSVFDTLAMSSLVQAFDVPALVNQWLPEIIIGTDRLCRLLVLMLWHRDAFIERYGDDDAAKLESLLRDASKRVGELVLELRESKWRPPQDDEGEYSD